MRPLARRRLRRFGALLTLIAVVTAGSSCGIPPDRTARSLSADEVPYGLLDQGPPITSPPATAPAAGQVNVAVYFLRGERLQPARRAVPDPPTPARVINALLAGPTDDEAVGGMRTAINPATQATISRATVDVVAVDLTPDFAAVPGIEQRLALAQIVFTATAMGGVSGVRFSLAGAPIAVPLPDGTATAAPVGRDAFATLAPAEPEPNGPA